MNIDKVWIMAVGFAVIFILPFLYFQIRKIYARYRVTMRSPKEKAEELNRDLEPFGFLYDEKQDIVYSGMYPWQRELGYCRLYDRAALALNMAIQSEPVYFEYDNRRWLIEFWKGQYGMATGAEVGIYVTEKNDILIPGVFEGPFFDCVKDEERIKMQYLLYEDRQLIAYREDLHWWLTAFDVGRFSKPKQLIMRIQLTFPSLGMRNAFLDGLEKAGYGKDSYRAYRTSVQITFSRPKSGQPYDRVRIVFFVVQYLNRLYCRLFLRLTKDFIKTLDKIDYIRFLFPWLYRRLTGFAKADKLREMYLEIVRKKEEAEEVGK